MEFSILRKNPVSKNEIKKLESELNYNFGDFFHNFVSENNGALLGYNEISGSMFEGVSQFISIDEMVEKNKSIDGMPSYALVLAQGYGGQYFYINKMNGSVYYWDQGVLNDSLVCESFEDFIFLIKPKQHEDVNLDPNDIIDVWVDPDFKPEF